jgi:hypothetical protein
MRFRKGESSAGHLDWIDPSSNQEEEETEEGGGENINNDRNHDYNSAYGGSNRYVTFLFALRVAEVGGQIVFPLMENTFMESTSAVNINTDNDNNDNNNNSQKKGKSASSPQKYKDAISSFPRSWEKELLQQCETRFRVTPLAPLDAFLFYSQKPNGVPDYLALNGICPVLQGESWFAAIHIWNGGRDGASGKDQSILSSSSSSSSSSPGSVATTTTVSTRGGFTNNNNIVSSSGSVISSSGSGNVVSSTHNNNNNNNDLQNMINNLNNNNPSLFYVSASFESKDVVSAKLYWEDQVRKNCYYGYCYCYCYCFLCVN